MAIMDAFMLLSDNQTLTGITSASSVESSNVIDLGADGLDAWGNALANKLDGGTLKFNVQVGATAATTAPIGCTLYTHSSNSSLASGTEIANIIIHHTSTEPNYGSAGKRFGIGIPQGFILDRYIGVAYLGVGGNPGDIAVDAWVSMDTESNP
jgi:hypothetical protein